jgi:hypothetical protein
LMRLSLPINQSAWKNCQIVSFKDRSFNLLSGKANHATPSCYDLMG